MKQERINDIVLECFDEFESFDEISDRVIRLAFNKALSRIREEQEPYGYRIENHAAITFTRNKETYESCGGFPLFTIPPVSPDCKELVEALENINRMSLLGSSILAKDIHSVSSEVIAKHKASMGEKE